MSSSGETQTKQKVCDTADSKARHQAAPLAWLPQRAQLISTISPPVKPVVRFHKGFKSHEEN